MTQAKRYAKTVPPTAVRDLYGTVHAEGATKGLLITTGGFGPSSYDWANGKPLQLISGTELLRLCHKYEIPVRIVPKETPRVSRYGAGQESWHGMVGSQFVVEIRSP